MRYTPKEGAPFAVQKRIVKDFDAPFIPYRPLCRILGWCTTV
jgi:hypothetical protein